MTTVSTIGPCEPSAPELASDLRSLLSEVSDLPFYFFDPVRDQRLANLVADGSPESMRTVIGEVRVGAGQNRMYSRHFEAAHMEDVVADLCATLGA